MTPDVLQLEDLSSTVENVIIKKRGRPALDTEERESQVNYRKSFDNEHIAQEEEYENTVGENIVELIKEGGAYKEKINGEECLSIVGRKTTTSDRNSPFLTVWKNIRG